MGKKKRVTRTETLNELKTLESKWLKDRRLAAVEPVQAKVCAAKAAALLYYAEQRKLDVDATMWPLPGLEDLVKMDEPTFKQGLADLQEAGVLNNSLKFRKVVDAVPASQKLGCASKTGLLHYRCAKPGGLNLTDRDEYVMEDQEVAYSEEEIGESPALQTAIANEWLVRIDAPKEAEEPEENSQ